MKPTVDLTQPRTVREQQMRDHISQDEARGATLLAQCLGLTREKRALFERLLVQDWSSSFQLPLVRDLDDARVAELVEACIGHDDRANLLVELARHHPAAVRPHLDRITIEPVRAAARAEGPDAWADAAAAAYASDRDVRHIKELSQLQTEHAADLLVKLADDAPDDHIPMIALAIESCGMFANNNKAAWTSDAFRAYVVSRDESPHHFGRGYEGPVPVCRHCDTPAERLLTLDAKATYEAYMMTFSPTWFWWRCGCDNGNMLYVALGDTPVDTPMSKGPVADSPIPHGSWALAKVERSVVAGPPAWQGGGEHQVGGAPTWIRKNFNPRLPDLEDDVGMCFLASFDLECTPLGWETEAKGIAYCFWDVQTRIAVTQLQIQSEDGGLFGF